MESKGITILKEEDGKIYVSYEDFAELEHIINENKVKKEIMTWHGKEVWRINK